MHLKQEAISDAQENCVVENPDTSHETAEDGLKQEEEEPDTEETKANLEQQQKLYPEHQEDIEGNFTDLQLLLLKLHLELSDQSANKRKSGKTCLSLRQVFFYL